MMSEHDYSRLPPRPEGLFRVQPLLVAAFVLVAAAAAYPLFVAAAITFYGLVVP